MATEKSISFRSNLESNSLDLIRKVGWNCARTSELIAGMVSQLAAYTEEGVPMSPSVFICSSVSQLVQLAGVGEYIPLSANVPLESAGAKILKDAAPLCFGHWRIFVERSPDGQRCNYGVFCGTSDPSSLTIDEVVLDAYDESFPVIRISQSATNKVEVRSNAGDGIEFRFNNDRDTEEITVHQHVRQLAEAISSKVEKHRELFTGYIDRVLSTAIKDCHGTLIAVVPSDGAGLPAEFSDIVRLDPPFHLHDRFQLHVDEGKTASSVSRLQAASELVSGFIDSDGITVFNDAGYVIGYRAFIGNANAGAPVTGGARSRAFGSMKAMVGHSLFAGQAYAEAVSAGMSAVVLALKKALSAVQGFDFVPESLRSQSFAAAASNVISVHTAMNNFYNEPSAIQALSRLGSTIPWPAFPICMSAILAVKLGNSYGTSHAATPTADELLKRLTKNQWEYYLNECLPGDELVLQKLSWYAKPRSRWIELVSQFQLPTKADKSSLVTKLLTAGHKAEEQTTATIAKALLEAMQK